jgi:flavin reductase (DIM6/NTAB) family NADH-FMN oxidoreductase RutF
MEAAIDKRALHALSYGLYIVSSVKGDRFNGQIANAVMQVTSDPAAVVACLHRENLTTECVRDSGVFSVSVLGEDAPMTFIGNFGFKCGRDFNKFESCSFETGQTGAPLVLEHSIAVIEARVIKEMEIFTHVMFFGEVSSSRRLSEGRPLTYAHYRDVKKGKSPRNAPTFILNDIP